MEFKPFNILRAPEGESSGGGGTTTQAAATQATTATEVAATSPPSILNPDFTFADKWQEAVGEEAKGLTFKSLPDLIKSNKAATAKITELSQKVTELGGGEAQPIPADTAGYVAAIKLPDSIPDGVHVPAGLLEAAAKYGIEQKIPPSITEKFVHFQIQQAGLEAGSIKAAEFAALNTAKAEIESKVGKENYDVTVGNAKAAHDMLGLTLSQEDLLRNPSLVVSLAKIHKEISPGTLKGLGLTQEGQSATGKLQQAEDIVANESNPDYKAFHDTSDPRHEMVMDKYNLLISQSAGGR